MFEKIAKKLMEEGFDRKDVIAFGALNCYEMLYEMLTDAEAEEIESTCLATISDLEKRKDIRQALLRQRQHTLLGLDWKYSCAISWRKLRAQQMLQKHNLAYPGFEPKLAATGSVVLAEANDDNVEALAAHYQLHASPPGCMADVISTRRIDDEAILGLLGDDRSTSGKYWVAVSFAPRRFCEAFYSDPTGTLEVF